MKYQIFEKLILKGIDPNHHDENTEMQYIVRSVTPYPDEMPFSAVLQDSFCKRDSHGFYTRVQDLKVFSTVQQAREYKKRLELLDGRVIE